MKKLLLIILFTLVLSGGVSADTTNDKIKLDVTFCHSKNLQNQIFDHKKIQEFNDRKKITLN